MAWSAPASRQASLPTRSGPAPRCRPPNGRRIVAGSCSRSSRPASSAISASRSRSQASAASCFSRSSALLFPADAVLVGHGLVGAFLDEGRVALAPEHERLALVGIADARTRQGLRQGELLAVRQG